MVSISVIVPVYNVEKYIRRCIDSILAQTFTDYELILVDDGSPDNCGKICDEYAQKDSRVRVIHQENKGLPGARNAGLDVAKGKYIASCDSDDYWDKNLLRIAYDKAESEKADCVVFNYNYVDEMDNIREAKDKKETVLEIKSDKDRIDYMMKIKNVSGWEIWTRLLRREIIEKYNIRGCMTCDGYAEDLAFTTVYNMFARKTRVINKHLYYYLQRSDSIMGRSRGLIRLNELNEVSAHVWDYYRRYFTTKEERSQFAILHFWIMYVEYGDIIGTPSYCRLAEEIEKIERKEHFRLHTKNLFRCYDMLSKDWGKDYARRILMFNRYCIHRSWKRFSIESAIYYKFLVKV